MLGPWLGRLHNGKSTQWNREDGTPKRKVWHRFSDRQIRSERHYYASLNYIHANPVKHELVRNAVDWPWSSLHKYIETCGRDTLVRYNRKQKGCHHAIQKKRPGQASQIPDAPVC